MIGPQAATRSARRLGVAVIGTGRWGQNLVRIFGSLEAAHLVSVCDVDRVLLASLDVRADKATDYSRVLSDPRVDAVVIATPPRTHADLAVAALDAGRHVFVEKPMALTVVDAQRVLRAARLSGRRGMVGFILHYHPALLTLKHWIDRGALGRVRHVLSWRHGSPTGVDDPGPWWSLGPHDVSATRHLLGRNPRSISVTRRFDGNATTVSAELAFTSDCTARISVAYGTGEKVRRLVVAGTRATALFDDLAEHKLVLFEGVAEKAEDLVRMGGIPSGLRSKVTPELPRIEPLRVEATHFVDALASDTPFWTDITGGARVVAVLEAGERSLARGGRAVSPRDDRPQERLLETRDADGGPHPS